MVKKIHTDPSNHGIGINICFHTNSTAFIKNMMDLGLLHCRVPHDPLPAFSLQFFIHIFLSFFFFFFSFLFPCLRPSNHLNFGLPLFLLLYNFPFIILFCIYASFILKTCPSHCILLAFIILMSFPLIIFSIPWLSFSPSVFL